ncbi:MAG: hypothetical protein ACR2PL_03630 [Dehalococcoidia bacterium]
MSQNLQTAIQRLLDWHAPAAERLALLHSLRPADRLVIRDACLSIASDPTEAEEVARSAGVALAMLQGEGIVIPALVLADFTGPAYLGFDEQMTEVMVSPPVR